MLFPDQITIRMSLLLVPSLSYQLRISNYVYFIRKFTKNRCPKLHSLFTIISEDCIQKVTREEASKAFAIDVNQEILEEFKTLIIVLQEVILIPELLNHYMNSEKHYALIEPFTLKGYLKFTKEIYNDLSIKYYEAVNDTKSI